MTSDLVAWVFAGCDSNSGQGVLECQNFVGHKHRRQSNGIKSKFETSSNDSIDLDIKMEMTSEWRDGVRKQEVWLSGFLAYEKATEVMERIGQVGVSKSSVWRQTLVCGSQLHALEEKERAESVILPGRWEGMPTVDEKKRMGAAMDGGMIFVLGEGWKDMKSGFRRDMPEEFLTAFSIWRRHILMRQNV